MKLKHMASAAGTLFFISTAAYLVGDGLLGAALDRGVPLAALEQGRFAARAGVFLEMINAAAVAGIAMFLYPILRKHNEALAAGYFGFRLLESMLLMLSAAMPILLLGMNGGTGGGPSGKSVDATPSAELAGLLVQGYSVFFQLAMVVLGVGSLLLCFVLGRYRLVPRLLTALGWVGYAALLASSGLSLLGQEASPLLFVPGALFEIAFPLWLIFKGTAVPEEAGPGQNV